MNDVAYRSGKTSGHLVESPTVIDGPGTSAMGHSVGCGAVGPLDGEQDGARSNK